MPESFHATGGARLGSTNATWPFARLLASAERLTLSVSLLGKYEFSTEQVSSLSRYSVVPVVGWGVQIHHRRADYPQPCIFWCLGNPDAVLRGIEAAGFRREGRELAPAERPVQEGYALRWPAIAVALAIWNGLLLLGFSRAKGGSPLQDPFVFLELLSACGLSLGLLKSKALQARVLKPGRSITEIQPGLRLAAVVTGLMFLIFLAGNGFGWFAGLA